MYATHRYLPHQSSDCFDIFISMSSIINHPGGSEADPSSPRGIRLQVEDKVIGRLATCLAFKLQHLFLRPRSCERLKFSLYSNIRAERNTIYIILCKWPLGFKSSLLYFISFFFFFLSKLETKPVGQAVSTSCNVRS